MYVYINMTYKALSSSYKLASVQICFTREKVRLSAEKVCLKQPLNGINWLYSRHFKAPVFSGEFFNEATLPLAGDSGILP